MINRLAEPTAGYIFINGQKTSRLESAQLRLGIGYAIQSVGLFPHMTVADNIAVVPRLLKWEKQRSAERVEELLNLVGLEAGEYAGKYPSQLSGGEAQRIGVARALAGDPPILLMDEPFGAVDPLTRERLQAQFVRIQQELKKSVIMVTHDLDEAIRLADRIAIMRTGTLEQYDTPEEILARPASKFVHDFVGADRALKRLSRLNVGPYIKDSPTVTLGMSREEVARVIGQRRSVWALDEWGVLLGWIDRTSLGQTATVTEALVTGAIEEIAVLKTATLREALSRMLGQGIRSIPVLDENRLFLGEIDLADVETATAEGES